MSFTSQVKEELTRVEPGCSHCDRATLAALARIEGTLLFSGQGKYGLEIATEISSAARLTVRCLHTIYKLETEVTVRRNVLHKSLNYLITVPDQQGIKAALEDLGILGTGGSSLEMGIDARLVQKTCCQAAYLRGAFLGSGFIADPKGDFHFEITVEGQSLAEDLVALMDAFGVKAHVTRRRNSYIVYMKGGNAICEFLALTGAHQCALTMENERVLKSVRSDINRQVNFEMANQEKTASAALDQIATIRKIFDSGRADELSPGLRELAWLRVKHPEATLKELGEMAKPPLSKSAVYHRVRRLEEFARNL